MAFRNMFITILAIAVLPAQSAGSKKFLADDSSNNALDGWHYQEEIMNAMGSVLGCGGQARPEMLASIKKVLKPMWRTLPKTSHGGIHTSRIDRRSLRYLVHRYFMQTSSLLIRGFEPTRPVNDSYWGVADILSQVVPAYVESVLESKGAKKHGFSFEDAVSMVVALEQLIIDSESSLLDKVYADQKKPTQRSLSYSGLIQVLEAYMVQWMVDGEPDDIELLLRNSTLVREVVPHFDDLMEFAQGRMKALLYANHHGIHSSLGRDIWTNKFSFDDAHQIVGGITKSFQSYWQGECDSMKDALVKMDVQSTGRIPLAKFYKTAISTDWRFGESEAYLRELGALDESSSWLGPQVIIPNYVQSTSNCIVATSHYLVCCMNECEALLGEIEVAIGAPTATPAELINVVSNMTGQTTLDDDESPKFLPHGALTLQLEQVAKTNGGTVPLHGRLFAQWLHYVFPRECPFPHRMGMVSSVTPSQYGQEYVASAEDMKKVAKNASSVILDALSKDELQWMSQWSPQEEFIMDYSSEITMPWYQRLIIGCGGLLLVTLGGFGGINHWGKPSPKSSMAGKNFMV